MINGNKEFIDIIIDEKFRAEVFEYMKTNLYIQSYEVQRNIPILYKYRTLSRYSVDDIIKSQFMASSISSFNDIFDGTIQAYGNIEQRKVYAQSDFDELRMHLQKCGIKGPNESFINIMEEYYKQESLNLFDMLDYVHTYVFCLSETNDSTLMWAHYANENTGICIEYDFNKIDESTLINKSIFPVAYSSQPIDVLPLIGEKPSVKVLYPYDAAILCAALNKADVWEYEKEWRFVEIDVKRNVLRITKESVKPNRIIFGNRFLKPLFYFTDNADEKKRCLEHFEVLYDLLEFMIREGIMAAVVLPEIGSFRLSLRNLPADRLKSFINNYIQDKCEDIRLYKHINNSLIDFIDVNEIR